MNDIKNIFKTIDPEEITTNFFHELNVNWALLTSGNRDNYNTMTVSWGNTGILWHEPVVIVYCRPQRYTFEFLNKHDYYTLSLFDPEYKHIVQYCGSHTGRNVNKIQETGLKPLFTEKGNIGYEQSKLVLECQIIYSDDIKESNFIDKSLVGSIYPGKDFHRFFIGRITGCYIK